ncbi:hypothetical protein RRG08_018031 [Elysia crispata]|uniref:Uncharacterized protein n=1 Tax=Elysia crispata TaxID=231223 RepID=A0AAE1DEP9_9GAST|nr:hypothetical protein RRG08_018031 [Elysia crispata]
MVSSWCRPGELSQNSAHCEELQTKKYCELIHLSHCNNIQVTGPCHRLASLAAPEPYKVLLKQSSMIIASESFDLSDCLCLYFSPACASSIRHALETELRLFNGPGPREQNLDFLYLAKNHLTLDKFQVEALSPNQTGGGQFTLLIDLKF